MKLLQALAIITACIFLSCSKSSTPAPIPKGTLVFVNQSAYPYQVVVNGKIISDFQPGQTTHTVQYNAGSVSITVTQMEGYILYPTQKTFTGTLKAGGTLATAYP